MVLKKPRAKDMATRESIHPVIILRGSVASSDYFPYPYQTIISLTLCLFPDEATSTISIQHTESKP